MSSVGGIIGGVLCMLNQNRHHCMNATEVTLQPCSHADLSLGVPASLLACGSHDQSPQRQRVRIGVLVVEGRRGRLLSEGDPHSV